MNTTQIPFEYLSLLDGVPERRAVTLREVQQAADVIYASSCLEPSRERMEALNIMKAAFDRLEPDAYRSFCARGCAIPPRELDAIYEECPALWWYDDSFRKALHEMLYAKVAAGQVVLWHVYNMGYVVRTSTANFALDLHHRLSEEMVKYLSFAGITHNHPDHYTPQFAQAMNGAHKLLLTNFCTNDGYAGVGDEAGYFKGPARTIKVGDITIRTFETDHNQKLRRFVQPIEIRCGEDGDACVILTSGDTCDASQLRDCAESPDFFIVHPYVGLDVAEAARILHPKMTLVSHLQEFHHPVSAARWTWRQGYEAASRIWGEGCDAVVPVWGERIEFRR